MVDLGLEMIAVFRKEKGMTIDELSAKSGVPVSTIKKISAGITTDPNLSTVQAIAQALGCSVDDFSNTSQFSETFSREEKKMVKKYRSLPKYGKEAVDNITDSILELDRKWHLGKSEAVGSNEYTSEIIQFSVTEYEDPMSAGTGQPAGYGYGRNLLLIKEPPPGTSYVAPIAGDSMEPTYHNGDKLFIQACYSINVGEIGVFFMDGQQWVKELGDGILISHNPNPKYGPRLMTEDIRCQGRVLGVCDESYFGID